ncbi:MAG: AAA family ATPase [Candidatus Gastranaerophilales bacterium]|nr:AAA family ATPase [Candidatus Gastranaerophilales bacterium]
MRIANIGSQYSFKGIKINKKTDDNMTLPQYSQVRPAQHQVIVNWKQSLDELKALDTQIKEKSLKEDMTPEEFQAVLQGCDVKSPDSGKFLEEMYGKIKQAGKTADIRNEIADRMLQISYDSIKLIEDMDNAGSESKIKAELSDKKGVDDVAGYNYEMEVLNREFIDKVNREKQGEDVDVFGSILFFGPIGNGKTHITKSVAQASRCNIKKIRCMVKTSAAQVMQEIYDTAEKSEEQFNKDRTRTIIFIDEADKVFDKKSSAAKDFEDFIKTCSEKYHCSVFAATNHPNNLGVNMKDENVFPIKMSIEPPEGKNTEEMLKYSLAQYKTQGIDYPSLAESIENRNLETERKINNGQILDMCDVIWTKGGGQPITQEVITNYIKNAQPEISKKRYEEFVEDKKLLIEG